MPAYPLKGGSTFATTDQSLILRPQVGVLFHLVDALGDFDCVFAIAVDSQRYVRWSDGQDGEHSRDLSAVIRGRLSLRNMARTFDAGRVRIRFAIHAITGAPQKRGPTGRPTRIFDAGSVGVGYDAVLA